MLFNCNRSCENVHNQYIIYILCQSTKLIAIRHVVVQQQKKTQLPHQTML